MGGFHLFSPSGLLPVKNGPGSVGGEGIVSKQGERVRLAQISNSGYAAGADRGDWGIRLNSVCLAPPGIYIILVKSPVENTTVPSGFQGRSGFGTSSAL
jgi:hypothetical protein